MSDLGSIASARRLPRRFGRLLHRVGAATRYQVEALLVFASFAATAMATALRRESWRQPVRFAFVDALYRVAVQSVPTTMGTGMLIGFVLVTQVVYWLHTAGQIQLVGMIVVRLLVREIGPIIVGLIIFGRVGTGILVSLGEARPRGWLRQLERQGIDPVAMLVMPRMIAFGIGAFCLSTVLLVTTLVVGYMVASSLGLVVVPIWQFGLNVLSATDVRDFLVPPAKCVVIGMAIALVCCATALGRADESYELQTLVQRGFVRAALAILLVNGLFDLVG